MQRGHGQQWKQNPEFPVAPTDSDAIKHGARPRVHEFHPPESALRQQSHRAGQGRRGCAQGVRTHGSGRNSVWQNSVRSASRDRVHSTIRATFMWDRSTMCLWGWTRAAVMGSARCSRARGSGEYMDPSTCGTSAGRRAHGPAP